MELTGIHHLTAVTAQAARNHDFYTRVLGLRLVKKTVNQDDVSAYHLFYADGAGRPGTDLTFFDWPAARESRGTGSIVRTGLRLPGETSLEWWQRRLRAEGISAAPAQGDRAAVDFEDFEGQRLSLVADKSGDPAQPWARSPVPAEHQIVGLGPVTLSVPRIEPTEKILTDVLMMKPQGGSDAERVYSMGAGGPAAEIRVRIEPGAARARAGAGGVHHVAFRVPTFAEYDAWAKRLSEQRIANSGPVDRYYFRSLYLREPNGILFELATDGPGFAVDESVEKMGEGLALPPFLEPRRREIEAGLKPLSI